MRKIYTLNLIAGLLLAFMLFSNNVNSQNLVVNGDFETWTDATTPASWTLATNANQESTTIHGGTYSCKHVGGTKNLGQQFAIVAGKTYQFSGWYYVLSGDGSDFRTWSSWKNGTTLLTDNYDVLHPSGYFASAASWQQFSYTIGAPATATDFYLEFRTYSGATVFVDDISFIEVADIAAPVSSVGYPKAANINATSFDLTTKYDETSTAFYVVLPAGAASPSVSEVLAGTGAAAAVPVKAGSFASGTAETAVTIDGLTVDVTYDIYVVAQDDETVPNVQAEASKLTVTTATPPEVLLNADFEVDLTPFTAVSIAGAQVWAQSSFSGNGYAKVSGYSGGNKDNEDWLISPAIDLDASTENALSFLTAANFSGPDLGVFISTNFTGTYDSVSVVTATWTDITSQVTLSAGGYAWTESGNVDLSTYSGMIYVAFKYLSNTVDGAKTYEIDDFQIKGFLKPGSDATLSDLSIDATTITGFDAAKLSYTLELPMGTTTVPAVTYTTTDATATVVISNATDLAGDNAARTTTIVVTAQDGTTVQTYTVLFNPILEAATISVFRNGDATRTYVVTGEVLLTYKNASRNQKYVQDATGGMMIDDSKGIITTVYEVGDKITGLKGYKVLYGGLVEFVPTADPGAAVSSGNAVEPVVITIAQFNGELNTYESTYVTLENVVFTDAGTTITADAKANYGFTVGDVAGVMRTNYLDLDYMGGILPTKSAVSGIVIQYNGTAQLMPRSATDFYVYNTTATLSALNVNGTAVAAFSANTLTYEVVLPAGTSTIPELTYTLSNAKASALVSNATDLSGDAAARTSTIVVTAEDGVTSKTYSVLFSVYVPSTDASLSSLMIDGVSVENFATGTLSYEVLLPFGTTNIPVVTFTTTDAKASAVVTAAANLNGSLAERTATVLVTAEDGTTELSYSIVFTVDDNTGIANRNISGISAYPVPATDHITVTGLAKVRSLELMDITGKVLQNIEITGEKVTLNISNLQKGMYFLKTESQTLRFIKK